MTSLGKHLLLAITGPKPTEQDRRLLAMAALMGVSAETVVIADGEPLFENLVDHSMPGAASLAMSAETLAAIRRDPVADASLKKLLDGSLAELLVFGCACAPDHLSALSSLTCGAIAGIGPLAAAAERFFLPGAAVKFSRQLAGLGFSACVDEPVFAFELRDPAAATDVILTANERPVYLRLQRGSAPIFLLTLPLPDLDVPLSRGHGIEEHYPALFPPLIFLRASFGRRCWHAPQSTARLIIDDPVLSASYGFLDYSLLQKSMHRFRYGASIAFIPWNGWRTTRRNASRLLGDGSSLSICIHGCDHTNREFETQDALLLEAQAAQAMRRMEAQQQRTGADFEPVMVFPQGRFSVPAIHALRANHYLAAVNTTVLPAGQGAERITVGDFLRPAVSRYHGFPIFARHYPRRIFDLAFDLFLGKPALIVEHHDFFRGGCEAMEAVVAALYKVEPSLSWPTLSDQLARSCLERCLPDGSTEVLFFTRRFLLQNRNGRAMRFLLRKHEPDASAVANVSVDGVAVPWCMQDGFLQLEFQAQPGQAHTIDIVDGELTRQSSVGFGVIYNTGVLLRRGLSEFRDNTLARNARLLKIAQGIAKLLKVTGDA